MLDVRCFNWGNRANDKKISATELKVLEFTEFSDQCSIGVNEGACRWERCAKKIMTITKNCGFETIILGLKLKVQASCSDVGNQLSLRNECLGFRNKDRLFDGKWINVLWRAQQKLCMKVISKEDTEKITAGNTVKFTSCAQESRMRSQWINHRDINGSLREWGIPDDKG